MQDLVRTFSKNLLQHLVFRGGFVWRVPSGAALTFDDGPDPEFTPPMLELLRDVGVKATFFLIGNKVREHPELAARIVAEGHSVGGHGYEHQVITAMSAAELGTDLRQCRGAIREATGVDSRLFRPPKGEVDLASIRTVRTCGYRLVHWSRTYSDYRRDGLDPLLQRMRSAAPAPGDIILLHDNNAHTVNALARVLPGWRAAGLQFNGLA